MNRRIARPALSVRRAAVFSAPLAAALAMGAAVLALSAAAYADDEVAAVTATNELVTFRTGSPETIESRVSLSGLQPSELIVGLDFHPESRRLYAIGSAGRVYVVDRRTGRTTRRGFAPLDVPLDGGNFGVDFDPEENRIRVVSDADQNMRVFPDFGRVDDGDGSQAGPQPDDDLFYDPADVNAGDDPNVVALAYDRNFEGAERSTAYGIDSAQDMLVRLGSQGGRPVSADSGRLFTVGFLGIDTGSVAAFDIVGPDDDGWAALSVGGSENRSGLYHVDLATGAARFEGLIGTLEPIRAMAVVVAPPPIETALVGLTRTNELVRFRSEAPDDIQRRVAVTGLPAGEVLIAIDTSPDTGVLYALGSSGQLYTIDLATGVAARVGRPLSEPLRGTEFDIDFNPAGGRLRVVGESGQNLRVDPHTGEIVSIDTELAFEQGDVNEGRTPRIVAIAHDRNRTGARDVTLYGFDSGLDTLVRIGGVGSAGASGGLQTVAEIDLELDDFAGFEVFADADAFLTTISGGRTSLFRVDLGDADARFVGEVGTAVELRDLAVAPHARGASPEDLTIDEMTIRLDFDESGRDGVSFRGRLPFVGSTTVGRTVTVDVGGVSRTFVLNRRGVGRSDDDRFAIDRDPRFGETRFRAEWRRDDYEAALADEGLDGTGDARRELHTVEVTVTYDGTAYRTTVELLYNARAGRRGRARTPGAR